MNTYCHKLEIPHNDPIRRLKVNKERIEKKNAKDSYEILGMTLETSSGKSYELGDTRSGKNRANSFNNFVQYNLVGFGTQVDPVTA